MKKICKFEKFIMCHSDGMMLKTHHGWYLSEKADTVGKFQETFNVNTIYMILPHTVLINCRFLKKDTQTWTCQKFLCFTKSVTLTEAKDELGQRYSTYSSSVFTRTWMDGNWVTTSEAPHIRFTTGDIKSMYSCKMQKGE